MVLHLSQEVHQQEELKGLILVVKVVGQDQQVEAHPVPVVVALRVRDKINKQFLLVIEILSVLLDINLMLDLILGLNTIRTL